MENGKLLVVDDERLIRWALRQRLEKDGYLVYEAASGREALERFEEGVDLVLLDYRLPDLDGLRLLRRMKELAADTPVIMLTAHSNVDQAVEAMRAGAFHYAGKPFDLDEVADTVARALETTRRRRAIKSSSTQTGIPDPIIGESEAMKRVNALLARIAESPASTVLITGDSGTGKDLAAKVIHATSARSGGPFLNITCSALPATLLESELFGHERGAFTDARTRKKGLLEHAHGGTVFLDEIGEMEMVVQAKLLRFLEEKTLRRVGGSADVHADVRVIAATNVHLRDAVLAHSFREDLYYRLAVLTVHLPPLRERGSDLELLIDYFIERFNREFNKSIQGLTPGAMRLLNSYSWPGNVRELRNVVERAVLLADKSTLDVDDFQIWAGNASETSESYFWLPATGLNLRQLERSLVQQALERCKGNQTRAAALLGINRDQIRYRIEKFGLAGMKSRGKSNGDGSTLDDDNGGSSSYTDRSDDE